MRPSITVTSRITPDDDTGNARLQMWVSETSNNILPEVFLYQTIPGVPLQADELQDMFVAVCTYGDMDQHPSTRPTDPNTPFFRKRSLDLLFKGGVKANEYRSIILRMVGQTVEDICRVNSMEPVSITEVVL